MAHLANAILRVDDEAELPEPHRMDLRDRGFGGEMASGAAAIARGRSVDGVRPMPRR